MEAKYEPHVAKKYFIHVGSIDHQLLQKKRPSHAVGKPHPSSEGFNSQPTLPDKDTKLWTVAPSLAQVLSPQLYPQPWDVAADDHGVN